MSDAQPEVKGAFTMGGLRTETYRVPSDDDLVAEVGQIVQGVADQAYEWETPDGDQLDYDSEDLDGDYTDADYDGGGFTLRNALSMLVADAIAYGRAQGHDEGFKEGLDE